LQAKDVWTVRVRLQLEERRRDLAMFNLAIDRNAGMTTAPLDAAVRRIVTSQTLWGEIPNYFPQ
jgi:hypothetical protein